MTDKLFHCIEDAFVILVSKGVYRQAKLYRRFDGKEHKLYAGYGSGFIVLTAQSGTSHPQVSWVSLDVDGALLATGKYGNPVLDPVEAKFLWDPPT